MKYMGSKSKIAEYILPIIHERIADYNIHTYVEPFCGGCNIIDKVHCDNRIACDKNEYLIALYTNLDKLDLLPEHITHEHYSDVRDSYKNNDSRYPKWYIGAVGFLASYNGRFFDGGYSGIRTIANGKVRDYYTEAKNNLVKQAVALNDVRFYDGDYRLTCGACVDCLIYCDPPYKNTKQYGVSRDFNHEKFWDWCREMSERNIVLISEETGHEDFGCIWEMPQKRTIDINGTKHTIERLFEIIE